MRNHLLPLPIVVSLSLALNTSAATLYVDLNCLTPTPPYTNWSIAATNIQDAIDVSTNGDLILVTNGVYATGGRALGSFDVTNRVTITNAVILRSVNGPAATVIQGRQVAGTNESTNAVRCALLGSGALLSGFTLTNGEAGIGNYINGGGVAGTSGSSAVVSNCVLVGNICAGGGGGAMRVRLVGCVLTGNTAEGGGAAINATLVNCTITNNSAAWAGAMLGCTATNCIIANNSATNYGGGSGFSTLVNCTVAGNSLTPGRNGNGGGSYNDTLFNCIVYDNTAPNGSNYYLSGMAFCCSAPLAAGPGNMTNAPLFENPAAGDFHLQSNSPCINAGSNGYVRVSTDLDGNPRISGGTVDIGAYEFQNPASIISYAWLQQFGLATDGSADYIDTDQDGLNNWQEWQAGTDPTNSASVLKLLSLSSSTNPPGLTITWQSSSGVTYYVQRCSNLRALPQFLTIQSNIVGQAGTTSYTDTNALGPGPYFYRVGAGMPPVPTVHCVDLNCTNPVPPYLDWSTAATNIQDAVDVANPGDLILVTNGVYRTGGRIVYGALTNRVALTKAVTLRSINGPAVTFIEGYQMPGTTNGDSAVRCVYMTNNAVLAGFTLTNGATRAPGDTYREFHGGGVWCEFGETIVSNCVLTANAAFNSGGGSWAGTLYDCVYLGNRAQYAGGGAYSGALNRCRLVGNWAGSFGGGAEKCTLDNCLLTSNSAVFNGGGAHNSKLNNCTIANNSASTGGGGASGGSSLSNSIVYYNAAPAGPNIDAGSLYACCTTPLYQPGFGNITNEPLFVDLPGGDLHLRAGSPCINAGNNSGVASGTDLDGRPRIAGGTVDMGSYESQIHFVDLNSTNPTSPYWDWSTAATEIQDAVDVAGAGDQILVTNGVYQTGGRVVYGALTNRVAVTRPLTLQSVNGPEVTVIKGYQVPGTTNGNGAVRCVYLTNGAFLSGFTLTNGATRATGDSSRERSSGGLWCESTNATASNCVMVGNSSVYGGAGSYGGTLNHCTLWHNFRGGSYNTTLNYCTISSNSGSGSYYGTLNGCTLAGNTGGGAQNATLNGCTIVGNLDTGLYFSTARNCSIIGNTTTFMGGGALAGQLFNCLIVSNSARTGGGWFRSTGVNCTIVGNQASESVGGACSGWKYNCIIYYNSAPTEPNCDEVVDLGHNCTTPDPGGTGNITNEPLFVNLAGGDFRLQPNSPCINAGNNSYVTNASDFDGNPRISGGTVDIGAYEFQNPASAISYAWLQQYGLPTDGTADYTDNDNDQMNNFQEWRAGTDPTNSLSLLKMLSLSNDVAGTTVTWRSVGGVSYSVERSDLTGGAGFSTIQTNVIGQTGSTSFTDPNAVGAPRLYYRVRVP